MSLPTTLFIFPPNSGVSQGLANCAYFSCTTSGDIPTQWVSLQIPNSYLSHNRIESLPESLGHLTELSILYGSSEFGDPSVPRVDVRWVQNGGFQQYRGHPFVVWASAQTRGDVRVFAAAMPRCQPNLAYLHWISRLRDFTNNTRLGPLPAQMFNSSSQLRLALASIVWPKQICGSLMGMSAHAATFRIPI